VLPIGASPEHYQLTIDPNIADARFQGQMTLRFNAEQALPFLELNAIDLAVKQATLDGKAVTVRVDEKNQRLRFEAPITKGAHTLKVTYQGKIYEQSAGLFITSYRKADGTEGKMLSSQFEPGDARKLAPMWDEPSKKAVFEISIIEPKDQLAVSNMPEVKREKLADGRHKVQFAKSPKMSSYLLYVGAGDYERISGKSGGVDHGVITKRGDAKKGQYALTASYQLLDFYNDYFGVKFPLPKLDHLAVPGAGGFSAMENWGAIMYFEGALLLDPQYSTVANKQDVYITVAHEMAHQWFGNLVTMQWWDDLWLNEGFASWMETKATQHFNPAWQMEMSSVQARNYAMYQDSQQTTHPVVQQVNNLEEANAAFDGITYSKGLAVITMIEAYLGEDAFRQGVRAYMQQHQYKNTVTGDLWSALEKASGKPVRQIAKDFTTQPGVPMVDVLDARCEQGQTQVTVKQSRFGLDEASKQPLTWTVPVVARVTGNNTKRFEVKGDQPQTLQLAGCGPVELNAGQTGYYRVRYAPAVFEQVATNFGKLASVDQLGILKDSLAFAGAQYSPVGHVMTLIQQSRASQDPIIQADIANQLAMYDEYYQGKASQQSYRNWSLKLLQQWFAPIGWDAKAGESDNQALLRTTLIRVMAALGDTQMLTEARRRYAASQTDPAALPAALAQTVLRVLGAHGNADDFALLQQQATKTTNSTEQRELLRALASTQDDQLAGKVLSLALSKDTPKQWAPNLISQVAQHHPEAAYQFYLANQQAINDRLDPLRRAGFDATLLESSDSPAIQKLLQDKANAADSKPVKQAYEESASSIGRFIERRQRIPVEIDKFLDSVK
jgi:aminopeptidase N